MKKPVVQYILTKERQTAALNGDEAAFVEIYDQYHKFLLFIAGKFATSSIEFDDLVTYAKIGFMKALKYFDPDKGILFTTFLSVCSEREIIYALRSEKKLKKISHGMISLDSTAENPADASKTERHELIGTMTTNPDQMLAEKFLIETFNYVLRNTDGAGRREIIYKFFTSSEDMNQSELGDYSQSYISRIIKKFMLDLKRELEGEQMKVSEGISKASLGKSFATTGRQLLKDIISDNKELIEVAV